MNKYNYEERSEDKQNNYPKVAQSEDLNAKNLPANLSGENEGKFPRHLYYIKDKNEFFKWSW